MGSLLQRRNQDEELVQIQLEEIHLETKDKPVGLRNIGNTCYMNAVLQCLLQTEELYSALSKAFHGRGSASQLRMIESFRSVIAQPTSTGNLRRLKSAINCSSRRYVGFKQMDSNEFFLDLLNAIVELSPEARRSVGGLFRVDIADTKKCSVCATEQETEFNMMSLSLPLPPAQFTIEVSRFPQSDKLQVRGFENWTAGDIRAEVERLTGLQVTLVLMTRNALVRIVPESDSLHALGLRIHTLCYVEKKGDDDVVVELKVSQLALVGNRSRGCLLCTSRKPIDVCALNAEVMKLLAAYDVPKGGVIILPDRVERVTCMNRHYLTLLDAHSQIAEAASQGVLRLNYISEVKLPCLPFTDCNFVRENATVDLPAALDFYKSPHPPDSKNEAHCKQCDKSTTFSQQTSLKATSAYLVLCLQRYSFIDLQKDYRVVNVTETLFVEGKEYRLYAVIKHQGDDSRGHYTSAVRKGSDWFVCDDKTITKLALSKLQPNLQENAYILFYEQSSRSEVA